MKQLRPGRRSVVAAVSALALTGLAGCGSDSLDSGSGSSGSSSASATVDLNSIKTDDALAAMVPAKIKSAGTLKVGSDASYAPNEFIDTDGTTVVGMDIDMITAIGKKLGLKVNAENGSFPALILGVNSGKYDAAISSFTINADRMKQANMISYFNAGTLWATAAGNPQKVDPENACGLNIGVQKGTVQIDDLTARSKKCVAAGKQAITQVVEEQQSKVTADLVSGKVVAMAADSPVSLYAIQQTGTKLEKVGEIYDSAPYGVVVPKKETEFADAIAKALESLKADGTYAAILKKWNNDTGAIDAFKVNPTS